MKKALVMLAIMGVIASPVFAQSEMKENIGTVDSIDPINPETGDVEGGIILKDAKDSVDSFDITTTTVISDQATGKISSADIEDGDRVKVVYTVSDQGPVAVTILRLSADKGVSGK